MKQILMRNRQFFSDDDGDIRIGDRLQRSSLKVSFLILPPKLHRLVKLIALHYHEISTHSSQDYVIAQIGRSAGRFYLKDSYCVLNLLKN